MLERLAKLIDVKSIVTLVMLVAFVYLSVREKSINEGFMEIFKMVIIFYFGAQSAKIEVDK